MAGIARAAHRVPAAFAAAFAVALVLVLNPLLHLAGADQEPSNKITAASGTLEVMHVQAAPGTSEDTVRLMSAQIRTGGPHKDLVFSVSAECALWTNTATTGTDNSQSTGRVEVWVTLDGKIVPVSGSEPAGNPSAIDPADQGSRGRVVFCNRAAQLTTNFNQEDQDDVIRLFNRTRSANHFDWVALEVGDGVHQIEVFARLVTQLTSATPTTAEEARAAVGKRMLLVTVEQFANNATI